MRFVFCIFAPLNRHYMVIELLIVWIVGVVAFFVLWALLLKVIKRISERNQNNDSEQDKALISEQDKFINTQQ